MQSDLAFEDLASCRETGIIKKQVEAWKWNQVEKHNGKTMKDLKCSVYGFDFISGNWPPDIYIEVTYFYGAKKSIFKKFI